jgi:hypothetical protein
MAFFLSKYGLKHTKGKQKYPPFDSPSVALDNKSGATDTIDISWGTVTDAIDYNVQYKLSSNSTWITVSSNQAGLTYTFNVVSDGVSHDFRVIANFAAGESYGYLMGILAVPTDPVLSFGTIASDSIEVTWSSVTGADNYAIQYKLTSSGTWTTGPFLGDVNSEVITGLDPNASYDFRGQAYIENNNYGSGWGAIITDSTLEPLPDDPVITSVVADNNEDDAVINWNTAANAISYTIERRVSPSGSWAVITNGSGLTGNTKVDDDGGTLGNPNMLEGITYDYRMYAVNGAGNSGYSNIVSWTPPDNSMVIPATPLTLNSATPTTLTVDITPIENCDVYSFSIRDNNTMVYVAYPDVYAPDSQLVVTGLAPDTEHFIFCRFRNEHYTNQTNSIYEYTQLAAPTNIQISQVSTTSMRVGWDAPSGADTYDVWQRDVTGAGSWTQVATAITALFYDATGLSTNNEYEFYVVASNVRGDSPNSATNSATTNPAAPSAPINLTHTDASKTTINLDWQWGGGVVDRYEVEYKLTSEPTTWTLWDGNVTATDDIITGLAQETSYDFRVRAVNVTGTATSGVYTVSTLGLIIWNVYGVTLNSWIAIGGDATAGLNDKSDATYVEGDGGNGAGVRIRFLGPSGGTPQNGTIVLRMQHGSGSNDAGYTIDVDGGEVFSGTPPNSWTELRFTLAGTLGGPNAGINITRSGGGNPNNRKPIQIAEAWFEY